MADKTPTTYHGLQHIKDRPSQDLFKQLLDRIAYLEQQAASIGKVNQPLASILNGAGYKVQNIGDPIDLTDAVNVRTMQRYIQATLQNYASPLGGQGGAPGGNPSPGPGSDPGFEFYIGNCDSPPPNGDLGVGEASVQRCNLVICGVGQEWAALRAITVDQPTRDVNTEELLLRMIWHLNQTGFTAGRQRNPSGVIAPTRLTALLNDGRYHAFKVFPGSDYTTVLPTQFVEDGLANYVAEAGTPD